MPFGPLKGLAKNPIVKGLATAGLSSMLTPVGAKIATEIASNVLGGSDSNGGGGGGSMLTNSILDGVISV